MVDVVVLGGGPAGLAAAWRAAGSGRSVLLLERAPAVGGMAASFEVAGVRVDTGSHRLHPATPAPVLSLLRGLLGGDLQTRRRNGRLRVYDRWVDFPLRPVELARTLPPAALLRIGRDAATRPVTRPDPTSYASLLVSTLGPELYNALYGPYAEKLWGLPGRDIDAEQARRRVSTGGVWGIARTLVRRDRSGPGRVFFYPRRGFGQIADVLAEAAAAAGAAVETGAEVTAVEPEPDGVTVSTADGRTVRAGHVFSTVPLPVLARLAGGPVPPTGLAFRAMVLVYLVHTGGRWTGSSNGHSRPLEPDRADRVQPVRKPARSDGCAVARPRGAAFPVRHRGAWRRQDPVHLFRSRGRRQHGRLERADRRTRWTARLPVDRGLWPHGSAR